MDLGAVVPARPDGVVVPKLARAREVEALDEALGRLEDAAGIAVGAVRIVPSIETAAALADARAILAASPRVAWAGLGFGDLALDLGLPDPRDDGAWAPYRAALVLASRAAGRGAPVDGVWPDLEDEDGLRRSALAARRLGLGAKRCVHPRQVAVVNAAFAPSGAEVAAARRVVEAADAAGGDPGAVRVDDRLVDAPVIAATRATLAHAGAGRAA